MHLNKRKKKKFNPGLALIGVRTTGPPGQQVACEQALHLGDIVKSTRARGDATAGAGPSRFRRSLARSRAARFARPNRRACSQARQ